MKHIFKIFTLTIVSTFILLCTSCKDFLEEEPYGILTTGTAIKTPDDMRAAVDGIYETLRSSMGGRYSVLRINWLASEISTTSIVGDEIDMDLITLVSSNRLLDNSFQSHYEGIKRANTVVEFIDEIIFNSEDTRNEFLAEARFMRAYYYFNLVRLFGAVPKNLSVPKGVDEVFLPRTNPVEIYNDIILPDLEYSVSHLPEVNDDGRANRMAAQMILSKVHMTMGDWSQAIGPIEEVVNNTNYKLIPDWADLWSNQNDNSETIFAIQYIDNTQGQMNTLSSHFGIGANGIWTGPLSFAEWSYYNNYPEGPRKDALFFTEYVTPSGDTARVDDPGWGLGRNFPLFKIYIDSDPDVLGTGTDIVLLRYADALLMYAEILNELNGPNEEAFEAINKVRRRAAGFDMDTPSSVDLSSALSQTEFRDAVFQERRWELPLEGHSWFDAVRSGLDKFREVMAKSEPHSGEVNSNIEEFNLLMPFPAFEIQRNDAIDFSDQNPGY